MATAKRQTNSFKTAVHKPRGDVTDATPTSFIQSVATGQKLHTEPLTHRHIDIHNPNPNPLIFEQKQPYCDNSLLLLCHVVFCSNLMLCSSMLESPIGDRGTESGDKTIKRNEIISKMINKINV